MRAAPGGPQLVDHLQATLGVQQLAFGPELCRRLDEVRPCKTSRWQGTLVGRLYGLSDHL